MINYSVLLCGFTQSIILVFNPMELTGKATNTFVSSGQVGSGWSFPRPWFVASNKFCYTDQETGVKSELTLIDGGDAEITFYNSSGVAVRRGEASWNGTSDGPGGDMPRIYLRLSTGVTLTFRAVVDQYTAKITMLMDSRDNMWLSCY